ncbi:hypothetical protein E8E13_006450 [Curvularia kusanoi]|uniref:F-box domain-containing protein n=1 Tax=Curvularia kusanoi TaxID=90978 RepID=A0A9P4TB50_CURKU|nr:hypothetical protein E8E13_006450 [Curvularia kusanoi]
MASAAGAPPPPPPPPPPPRGASFDYLPAELLLEILQYLDINSSLQFALTIYPTLRRHSLVPQLTLPTYMRIARNNTRCWELMGSSAAMSVRLPMELWLQIAEMGSSRDNISLTLALAEMFILLGARPLSDETKSQLRVWARRKQ